MATPNESHRFGFRDPDSVQSFFCPSCEVPLTYEANHANDSPAGLVDFADYDTCQAGCGTFEYERHRHRLSLADAGYSSGGAGT